MTGLRRNSVARWTRAAVLTGDIQTDNDTQRLLKYGYPVRQITTGGACHLDARVVADQLYDRKTFELLLIENASNLVCPTRFIPPCLSHHVYPTSYDLGEDAKVMVLSGTRSEDKPLK
jgi:hydrogenase nickel incorporation protein HypB